LKNGFLGYENLGLGSRIILFKVLHKKLQMKQVFYFTYKILYENYVLIMIIIFY